MEKVCDNGASKVNGDAITLHSLFPCRLIDWKTQDTNPEAVMCNSYMAFRSATSALNNLSATSPPGSDDESSDDDDYEAPPPPNFSLIPRTFDRAADCVLLPSYLVPVPQISVSARRPVLRLKVTRPADRDTLVQIHRVLMQESEPYRSLWGSYTQ